MRTSGQLPAVTIAVIGGVAIALGSSLPVVAVGSRGFNSSALLVVLAIVPVAAAAALLWRGRGNIALGVVIGLAALAPGRLTLDLRYVVDASMPAEPALYMPDTLADPEPASGLWLLLAGNLAMLLAGVVAARSVVTTERWNVAHPDGSPSDGPWHGPVLAAGCAGTLAAVGALAAPFGSNDAYLLAEGAVERNALGLLGSLLFAAALPLLGVIAASTGRPWFARGCFLGLGLGALAANLPNLVASLVMPELSVRLGPIVALLGAIGLLALAVRRTTPAIVGSTARMQAVTQQAHRAVLSPTASGEATTDTSVTPGSAPPAGATPAAADAIVHVPVARAGDARLPSLRAFELAIAVAALATCAVALTGSLTAQVTSAVDAPTDISPRWSLLVSGVFVGVLGLALGVPRLAGLVRPTLSVGWVSVLVAGMPMLGAGVAAGETGGALTAGPGVLWTGCAMALAVITAGLSTVAGVLDREGLSRSVPGTVSRAVAIIGVLLGAVAFVLPVARATDRVMPGMTSPTTASWGLLAGLLMVVGACWTACYSRPARAAALLAGITGVLALRTVELPLWGLRVSDPAPTVGWWFALLGTLVTAVAAGMIFAGRLPSRNTARTS